MTKTSTNTSRSRVDDDTTTLRARAIEARAAAEAALAAAERAAKAAEPRLRDDSPDPAAHEQPQRPARRSGALRGRRGTTTYRAAVAFLVVTSLAGSASGVKAWWDHRAVEQHDSADQALMHSAEGAVVELISTSKDDPDAYVRRILDNAAGQWHDDFDARKQTVLDTMKAAGNVTVGHAVESGIERRNDDGSTTVLVAASADGNIPLAGSGSADPATGAAEDQAQPSGSDPGMTATIEPQEYQLRVDVVEVDGQLKLSKVGFVQ
ncbi:MULTISPECIES: hypothetical protein [Rhodococcus]|uniref:Uncharacterized protein n=1 Tax=Rhodococcus oxybenzonivorans TaxID=1990687 RepID=A0AAE4UXL2_9NOCA|nr:MULTISPECIES: hypothetical protein [Rhodococcus]MDV7241564.1 hypothetical protein [Rhodococcus oxybenzonivorans]MDV7264149.1 hypothetical protein [Rhodococcus oxybenzonivorans]MDV7273903.1 hypothetical protein [Rhodococcus oxybenzonivorans]MDV7333845.1 hypothetical protein [Rhodococcus oxybenzonivorans]MDV7343264.1 hypothetical protein [Rhodococcus oxybenzonivorans]